MKIDNNRGVRLDLTSDIKLLIIYLSSETNEFGSDHRLMVKCFFDLFSTAYPNWEYEYQILGKELELYFGINRHF